ncbi:MAG: 23S rRNA (adenine(2503)-C(2))-methyltransferase RlmN [Bacteroidota bacterium]|nr:23S rRNA (adenine(2503)-C(2))-methyltransferase RlmN [Bacteroidota bacterium]
MSGETTDIRSLSAIEIGELFVKNSEKPFRAKQVYEWLWKKGCRSFDEMTNLPRETRKWLTDTFSFHTAAIDREVISRDGTVKCTFLLHDGSKVEGVLIPAHGRTTACISSQVGCPLNCLFCATGHLGFTRNLHFFEIFDQVSLLNQLSLKQHNIPLSNIVYMGMGEPLLNYEEVMASIQKITDPESMAMSPQRITVSSVGIPEMILRMAGENPRFHFALSLHSAIQEKRCKIIPVSRKYTLEQVKEALIAYHKQTGKRFTIEYILFNRFNDGPEDALALAKFCKSFPVKINLITYNRVPGDEWQSPELPRVNAFKELLDKRNMVVNIRKSRGQDIEAACGQLAGMKNPE